jgi:hypothetical protein
VRAVGMLQGIGRIILSDTGVDNLAGVFFALASTRNYQI